MIEDATQPGDDHRLRAGDRAASPSSRPIPGALADARELERQTRAGAEDYADEVFGHVEQSLDTLLNNTRRCRDRLNAAR